LADPAPLNEDYLSCINSTFTYGATPDTASLNIIDGGYTLSFGVEEMTNNGSGGAYEDVKTYKQMEGNFTGAYVSGTPPTFKSGEIYPVVIDCPNGPYFAGNCRFNQVENPVLDVKAGVKYKFGLRSQGAFTTVRPSP